jgi:hypothetical protein
MPPFDSERLTLPNIGYLASGAHFTRAKAEREARVALQLAVPSSRRVLEHLVCGMQDERPCRSTMIRQIRGP